ncbi:M48 family metalloprotease [Sphingobium sp. Sx8-8]|uniref:M48 family metalloprotease n=1 Tax=Sphingobium sp. Sx8-8 TaxID=2933617 RepID=UPI001F5A475D|nr:M48 family metalloprotease [Sphingobium sp. Sx8-8]
MLLLNDIDWRLKMAAGQNCRYPTLGTGIVLDSLLAYRATERPALATRLGLGEIPQVIGLAHGSPGEAAGLAVGDRITGIGGIPAMDMMLYLGSRDVLPENILRNIADMAPAKPIRFEVERKGEHFGLDVQGIALCGGTVTLKSSHQADAFSDRNNIAVTTGMVSMLETADEMAFIIGHEFTHILFEDSKPQKISRLEKENRADLYGTLLAACAGFDPKGAITALEKLKRRSGLKLDILKTHHGFDRRQKAIRNLLHSIINCEEIFGNKHDVRS